MIEQLSYLPSKLNKSQLVAKKEKENVHSRVQKIVLSSKDRQFF